MEEVKLMKGNEAVAYAAIRCGCDGYFGYPITPQSEILETLTILKPWETTGMQVLQAESEIAAINMLYGGASCGKRVLTSSSSPGISLMSEGISYIAGAQLPCVIINVQRGGPGLGTIQPAQSDYLQAVKAAGHGDFDLIVLAPSSVQDMHDFVYDSFELAFKYMTPVLILSDGAIGQMMEKVRFREITPRKTNQEIIEQYGDWAVTGKKGRTRNVATSLQIDPYDQEQVNIRLQAKYKRIRENEIRYEEFNCEGADYVIVAYGLCARICTKVMNMCQEEGLKVGLLRPITLLPFPEKRLWEIARSGVKGFIVVEMNMGQMIQDVKISVASDIPVEHFGRAGGVIPSPQETYDALKKYINKIG